MNVYRLIATLLVAAIGMMNNSFIFNKYLKEMSIKETPHTPKKKKKKKVVK